MAKSKINHFEEDSQQALVEWARLVQNQYPGLELLFASPGGASLSGKPYQKANQMKRLKKAGFIPGFPDLILPVPKLGFTGLAIEMKHGSNKPSDNQMWWLNKLKGQGWSVHVCYNWIKARDIILTYIEK